MELIIEPKDGLVPLVAAIKKATKQIDVTIFRFDLRELQRALESAVTRGVKVHALIAHTSGGGQKRLRKLELELLNAGVTVSRTDDELRAIPLQDAAHRPRDALHARLQLHPARYRKEPARWRWRPRTSPWCRKRSSCSRRTRRDSPTRPNNDSFLVSPENARTGLARFIKSAKKELLIYDMKVSDRQMIKLLQDRVKAGVDVRILGKVGKRAEGLTCEKMPVMRLHLRAMLRDGQEMFLGSMSLRALELDKRREVGVIVKERAAAKQFRDVFEEDWAQTESGKRAAKDKEKEKDEKREAAAAAS